MEPAREERDDRVTVCTFPAGWVPQWSPLVKSGMTFWPGVTSSQARGPQWSPLVKSGMTGRVAAGEGLQRAAMEPAREERDD